MMRGAGNDAGGRKRKRTAGPAGNRRQLLVEMGGGLWHAHCIAAADFGVQEQPAACLPCSWHALVPHDAYSLYKHGSGGNACGQSNTKQRQQRLGGLRLLPPRLFAASLRRLPHCGRYDSTSVRTASESPAASHSCSSSTASATSASSLFFLRYSFRKRCRDSKREAGAPLRG